MPPQPVPSQEEIETVTCDTLVVGAFAGDSAPELSEEAVRADRLLGGFLADDLRRTGFRGKVGDFALLPTHSDTGAGAIAVVGLGPRTTLDEVALRRAAAVAARRLSEQTVVASALPGDDPLDVRAAVEGFLLGSYRFTTYKSQPRPNRFDQLLVLGTTGEDLTQARIHAEATALARDLTNEPAGNLTPAVLARRAQDVADVNGLECNIVDEAELEARGFGGISAIGRGSPNPPRLIELRYTPGAAAGRPIILVGKGVTFDSGGLSLKDRISMEQMKTDMAGAAAVIGCMSAIPRLDLPVGVHAYIPAVENMPGAHAIRPGDVVHHYGGKTSEVTNTDAEGRIILADAVALASEQDPACIVDVATLTGAIQIALGSRIAGLFSNEDALANEIEAASRHAGERFWRLPLETELRGDLDSPVADIKNSGPRYAGAILAALFIKEFLGAGVPWAHLDIAGTGRSDKEREEITRGGTGFATRTLLRWLESRTA